MAKRTKKSVRSHQFKYPLVHVTWEDAHTDSDWRDISDIKNEPALVTQVGFMIQDNDDCIMIAMGYSGDHVMDRIRIPRGMVRAVELLEEPAATPHE